MFQGLRYMYVHSVSEKSPRLGVYGRQTCLYCLLASDDLGQLQVDGSVRLFKDAG